MTEKKVQELVYDPESGVYVARNEDDVTNERDQLLDGLRGGTLLVFGICATILILGAISGT